MLWRIFLHGFEGLNWDYNEDKDIALKLNFREINKLRHIASNYYVTISTGFIENNNDCLYSSNIVINKNGEIIDVFGRVSSGWKEAKAVKEYM